MSSTSSIPVFIYSKSENDSTKADAKALGAEKFLSKNISDDALVEEVKSYLASARRDTTLDVDTIKSLEKYFKEDDPANWLSLLIPVIRTQKVCIIFSNRLILWPLSMPAGRRQRIIAYRWVLPSCVFSVRFASEN